MKSIKLTGTVALVLGALLQGCGSKAEVPEDGWLEGVPEQAAFELDLTGDASSEGLATDADSLEASAQIAEGLATTTEALDADVAPELAHCRDAIRRLNAALRGFMEPIVALVRDSAPASEVGEVRSWGPIVRGDTEFQFVLRRGAPRHFGWLLQARVAGSDASFTTVAAGGISVGFRARRGRGSVGLDLDAVAGVDPTIVARGKLLAGFAHGPNGSTLGYALHDFTPDAEATPPLDALLRGVHLSDGYNRLRLAFHGDVPGSASAAEEIVLARARHIRGLGGRADLLASGGDIADDSIWLVSECWGPRLSSVYRVVRDCPADGIGGDACVIVSETGSDALCPRNLLEAEFPPADPQAAMPDPESPEDDVPPPDAMPDGTPPTD
jgi:hypothetical protein